MHKLMTTKAIALRIGILVIFVVVGIVLPRFLNPDVAAQVRPLIAAKWVANPAMKFARVDAVKLEHVGQGEYRGHVEYSLGDFHSGVPTTVTSEPFA
jgi:hypothetical protein